jgi:hypothetical protein
LYEKIPAISAAGGLLRLQSIIEQKPGGNVCGYYRARLGYDGSYSSTAGTLCHSIRQKIQ